MIVNTVGLLTIVAGFTLMGLLLRVIKVPRNILLMADATGEDDDIKIAGSSFGSDPAENEAVADQAAAEFLRQKEKGNIDMAGKLGELYADALWQIGQEMIMQEDENTKIIVQNKLMLYSFVINKVVAELSPTPLLAQTALSIFYKHVSETSSILDEYISDTGAMTLYMLGVREESEQDIGEIFAGLCGDGSNQNLRTIGNEAYKTFNSHCVTLFETHAKFNK